MYQVAEIPASAPLDQEVLEQGLEPVSYIDDGEDSVALNSVDSVQEQERLERRIDVITETALPLEEVVPPLENQVEGAILPRTGPASNLFLWLSLVVGVFGYRYIQKIRIITRMI